MMIILMIIGWIVCGIFAAGGLFATMQGDFSSDESTREDLGVALLIGLAFGPVALVLSIFLSGFYEHGWRLRWKP